MKEEKPPQKPPDSKPNPQTKKLLREVNPIRVSHKRYTVTTLEAYNKKNPNGKESAKLLGVCDFDHTTIAIRQSSDPDTAITTLFHEAIHAVLFDRKCVASERLICQTEDGLLDLFQKNPKLIRAILKYCFKKGK